MPHEVPIIVSGRGPAHVPRVQAPGPVTYKVCRDIPFPRRAVCPPADQSGHLDLPASIRPGVGVQGLVLVLQVPGALVRLLDKLGYVAEAGEPTRIRLLCQGACCPLLVLAIRHKLHGLMSLASTPSVLAENARVILAGDLVALQGERFPAVLSVFLWVFLG